MTWAVSLGLCLGQHDVLNVECVELIGIQAYYFFLPCFMFSCLQFAF